MAEMNGGGGSNGGRDRGEGRDASDFDRGEPEHGTGAQRDVGQGPGVGIDVGGRAGIGRADVSVFGEPTSAPPGVTVDWEKAAPGLVGAALSAFTGNPLGVGIGLGRAAFSGLGTNQGQPMGPGQGTYGGFYGGQPPGAPSAPREPGAGTSPELVAQRSLYEHPMLTQFYRSKFAPQTEANDSLARWVFRGHPSVPRV